MAGYLITLNDESSLAEIVKSGFYSTIMSSPQYSSWGISHEGTFADYLSMKAGDFVFFFVKRKIYGCGKLVNVGSDCKYLNYTKAGIPKGDQTDSYANTRLIESGNSGNRCFCTFVPNPAFFKKGIDMDAILQNKDNPFRSVRTLWKLSFIKMDDDESDALFRVLMKVNEDNINNTEAQFAFNQAFHSRLSRLVLYEYKLQRQFLISSCKDARTNRLKHEMALEAALCEILSNEEREPFGKWDYISHQVAASPFKPIDYMDKMDVFGYRYIPGYDVKSKYLIAELKKDCASTDIVEQIMKYVDWVSNEYANKDYSMIEAYIIASDFDDEVKALVKEHCIRNFTKGFRPTEFCVWNNLKMVRYEVVDDDIAFSVVEA
ncbi:MAG: hypothetical protein IK026_00745 [Eubacteriaceae bacterium]|nr:hypothetical protein [Eubacteriaceae bacterium]